MSVRRSLRERFRRTRTPRQPAEVTASRRRNRDQRRDQYGTPGWLGAARDCMPSTTTRRSWTNSTHLIANSPMPGRVSIPSSRLCLSFTSPPGNRSARTIAAPPGPADGAAPPTPPRSGATPLCGLGCGRSATPLGSGGAEELAAQTGEHDRQTLVEFGGAVVAGELAGQRANARELGDRQPVQPEA